MTIPHGSTQQPVVLHQTIGRQICLADLAGTTGSLSLLEDAVVGCVEQKRLPLDSELSAVNPGILMLFCIPAPRTQCAHDAAPLPGGPKRKPDTDNNVKPFRMSWRLDDASLRVKRSLCSEDFHCLLASNPGT